MEEMCHWGWWWALRFQKFVFLCKAQSLFLSLSLSLFADQDVALIYFSGTTPARRHAPWHSNHYCSDYAFGTVSNPSVKSFLLQTLPWSWCLLAAIEQ